MAQVFISYGREDRAVAEKLAAALAAHGLGVWWDRDLIAGREYDRAIEDELRRAGAVVVIWSPDSVRSRWVRAEAAVAAERDVMVPIRVAGAEPPLQFHNIQGVDLSRWDGTPGAEEIRELARSLRLLAATPTAAAAPAAAVASPRPAAQAPGLPPPGPEPPPPSPRPARGETRSRRSKVRVILAGCLAAVALAAASVLVFASVDRDGEGTRPSSAPTEPGTTGATAGPTPATPAPTTGPDTTPGTSGPTTSGTTVASSECASVLRRGCQGEAVRELQELLVAAGFDAGTPDGDFGRLTEAALVAFEHAVGLTVDGSITVDSDEWRQLVTIGQERSTPPPPTTVAVQLLSPPDGATLDTYPRLLTLRWQAVAGATGYHLDVQFNGGRWVDLGDALMGDCAARRISATSCTIDFVGANPGQWRVTAYLSDGSERVSEWWTFEFTR